MYRTVPLVVLYVMEKDAKSSALMQVVLPSFTSRETAWVLPVAIRREEEREEEAGYHYDQVKKKKKSHSTRN